MHWFERASQAVRHAPLLGNAEWMWRRISPRYNTVIAVCWPGGIERRINGETLIKLTPELHGLGERYEPEVWKQLLNACKKGDIIADVGAHVGLYTVAMA